jgi:hypothetical protein
VVADPGAPPGADRLRPLNLPRPVAVLTDDRDDRPAVLVARGRHRRVVRVRDTWLIDEEWWRTPIRRRYHQLVLDDGSLRTVYRDLVANRWYEQEY